MVALPDEAPIGTPAEFLGDPVERADECRLAAGILAEPMDALTRVGAPSALWCAQDRQAGSIPRNAEPARTPNTDSPSGVAAQPPSVNQ